DREQPHRPPPWTGAWLDHGGGAAASPLRFASRSDGSPSESECGSARVPKTTRRSRARDVTPQGSGRGYRSAQRGPRHIGGGAQTTRYGQTRDRRTEVSPFNGRISGTRVGADRC